MKFAAFVWWVCSIVKVPASCEWHSAVAPGEIIMGEGCLQRKDDDVCEKCIPVQVRERSQ